MISHTFRCGLLVNTWIDVHALFQIIGAQKIAIRGVSTTFVQYTNTTRLQRASNLGTIQCWVSLSTNTNAALDFCIIRLIKTYGKKNMTPFDSFRTGLVLFLDIRWYATNDSYLHWNISLQNLNVSSRFCKSSSMYCGYERSSIQLDNWCRSSLVWNSCPVK